MNCVRIVNHESRIANRESRIV